MANMLSRRNFLSAAAAAPAVPGFFLTTAAAAPPAPEVLTSTRIITFLPAPERVRIATVRTSFAAPATMFSPADIQQIESQGKDVKMTVPESMDELNALLPEVDVVIGAVNAEMLAKAKNLRWMQHTEAGV